MDWQFEQHGPRLCFIASAESSQRLVAEAEAQLARRRQEQLDQPLALQSQGELAGKRDRLAAELHKAAGDVEAAETRRRKAVDAWTAALENGRDAKAARAKCDQTESRLAAARRRKEALAQLLAGGERDVQLERAALLRRMALRTLRLARDAEARAAARSDETLDALAREHLAALMLFRHAENLQEEGRKPNG